MEDRILGIDLGDTSVGTAVREFNAVGEFSDQLRYFSTDIFDSGLGNGKSQETSSASFRTEKRLSRRLYDTCRRKLWATLHLLKDYNMCPISDASIEQWETYDKARGLKREYPVNDQAFAQWLRMEFDPENSTPFQLRRYLISHQLDFSQPLNRYRLGRAIYHIAQHRGFKSSKKSYAKDKDEEERNTDETLKASELKRAKELTDYMDAHQCRTAGEAFAMMLEQGVRIRNSKYQVIRSQLVEEIRYIFEFQGLSSTEPEFCKRILSSKKGEGTLFYQKEAGNSLKHLVGKCVLEPNKFRCLECHPEYEEFKAWGFLSNIRYSAFGQEPQQPLSLELKQQLYDELFADRVTTDFPFEKIRAFLEKKLSLSLSYEEGTINYRDSFTVSGTPVTARLQKLFGKEWQQWKQSGTKEHSRPKSAEKHTVTYDAMTIWHFCLDADDEEAIDRFATQSLGWDETKAELLLQLWMTIKPGYGRISLKAIRNINRFLRAGLDYTDSVLLAKVPDIVNDKNLDIDRLTHSYMQDVKEKVRNEKDLYLIANQLISDYKALSIEYRSAEHNSSYRLDENDMKDVVTAAQSYFGDSIWNQKTKADQGSIVQAVAQLYQTFFQSSQRKFYTVPRLDTALGKMLEGLYPDVEPSQWEQLYHPSEINLYPARHSGDDGERRLGTPNIGAIRNPVVLKTLNVLRKRINAMLDAGLVDPEHTRVVVELTRELNDKNMRAAIRIYQKQKEEERKLVEQLIKEIGSCSAVSEEDKDKTIYLIEQKTAEEEFPQTRTSFEQYKKNCRKEYKKWLEKGGICLYTGREIHVDSLSEFDVEHTLPRSLSFCNADTNRTLCDPYYNRSVKKTTLPIHLPNYEHDTREYTAIKPRLEEWKKKVDFLHKMVELWKSSAKRAQTPQDKDKAICQKHLWNMELRYWEEKLGTFRQTEITPGFRNRQLVDTGIITRHATLYLKSVFRHVEVEKGVVTATFRRILGLQKCNEAKDRNLHSHHAIDAAVLTAIPAAAKRDKMLQLYYQKEEADFLLNASSTDEEREQLQNKCRRISDELDKAISECRLGANPAQMADYINRRILINHQSTDRTFASPRKVLRKKGKIVYKVDVDKEKQPLYTDGDSIRGCLHEETYFGAIYSQKDGKLKMVIRKDLSQIKKKHLNDIIDERLRNHILQLVKDKNGSFNENDSLKKIIPHDIYMVDKSGKKEVTHDKHGHPLAPIRHIRCLATANSGYKCVETALQVRKHNEVSTRKLVQIADRSHKQVVYTNTGDNYLLLQYEGVNEQGQPAYAYKIINLMEAADIQRKHHYPNFEAGLSEDYKEIKKEIKKGNDEVYRLKAFIKRGTRIILWENSADELRTLSYEELLSRLYVIKSFAKEGTSYMINYQLHLYASKERYSENKDKNGIRKKAVTGLSFIIEHRDFTINELGSIELHF